MIRVLDHGFIKILNISGPRRRLDQSFDASDRDPANSARMSFAQKDSERTEEQDAKLCEYLLKNWHTTPFEMLEVWIEMKLPIFVARQFVRHRTVSINEVSARYVQLPSEWYIPEVVGGKAPSAKQGQEDNLCDETQEWFKLTLNQACQSSYDSYSMAISHGVAPEHARMFLHVNHYTHWLWKQDLHNMMHFLSLRMDSHTQVEAQAYATAIYNELRKSLPKTMDLFDQYRRK